MPTRSLPLAWEDVPNGAASLGVIFIDHDAIPTCGFSWIHWTVANVDPKLGALPENISIQKTLLEGLNSWGSDIIPPDWKLARKEDAIGYGGCAPPDKPHRYTVEVYALDTLLPLQRGFYMNDMLKAMEGHVLAQQTLHGVYKTQ
jgi:Raf kinase inhibitor-like YbhB/YbcL family protein